MKRVLITGAGGFIGSHLTEFCVGQGYEVRAFLHYNANNKWGWLKESSCKNDFEVVTGDVRDYDSVFAAMKGCDGVFHLAALIGIPYSYVSPLAYIRTNVEGTYNILQAARELKTENVLITSTSETYGSAQYIPIDEKHPMVGQSPYAATKIAADQLALSFYRSFDLPVKVARPFNTYGPRQSTRAIIPTIITQLLRGNGDIKLGSLTPTRDLTYVEDTIRGILAIAQSPALVGEITNVGSNSEISIGDLALKIASFMGKKINILEDTARLRPGKSEVERLCCNSQKIRTHTDWQPQYDLTKGLEETIAWFEGHAELERVGSYHV